MIVVEDRPDLCAVYAPPRTRAWTIDAPREEHLEWITSGREYGFVDDEWVPPDNRCLRLTRPGDAYSVYVVWYTSGELRHYYVNLESPLVRTTNGFEFTDHVLDIIVAPDGTWWWKDEDEFEQAQRVGFFTAEEADAVRREGERVLEDARAGRPPFDGSWLDWEPDPSWSAATMPADWAEA